VFVQFNSSQTCNYFLAFALLTFYRSLVTNQPGFYCKTIIIFHLKHLETKMSTKKNNDNDDDEINLKTDAEGQYGDWSIKCEGLAASMGVKVFGEHGMLNVGIGMTTAAWNRDHPGEPRPAPMVKPVLAGGAGVAEREAHKAAIEEWNIYVDALKDLKESIIADLSPALKKATWHVATGHRNMSITDFLDFLHVRFGVASDVNLKKTKKLIAIPWTSEADLEAQCELYKGHHAKLDALNQPRCQSDKLEVFETVTATLTNVVYYLRKYYEDTHDINARTLEGAMTYILDQERAGLFTSQSQNWAGGATAADVTTTSEAAIQRRIDAAVKLALQKQKGERVPSWCFKHGVGHPGTTCKFMLASPHFFTKEFLNATHECTIKGLKSFPNPNVFPA
jgi:hypothetical protein